MRKQHRQGRLHDLELDAVRIAGLAQERPRLRGIVRIEAGVGHAEIAVRHHRHRLARDLVAGELHHALAIDGVRDRLPHADVVERLRLHVEIDAVELRRLHGDDDGAGHVLGALDPLVGLAAEHHVDLAGAEREIARRVGGNVAVGDRFDLRRAAEVTLVGGKLHELLRLILDERERSGADRLFAETVAELGRGLAAHHQAAVIVRHQPEQARDRILQRDLQRGLVERLDLVDRREVAGERRGFLGGGALQGIGRVLGGELTVVAVALHPAADLEGPLGGVAHLQSSSRQDPAR